MDPGSRFPLSARLNNQKDFSRVFNEAKKSVDDCFTVLFRPNKLGHPRLGLAISKKSLKRAVDRNRVKRIVRESYRLAQAELNGLDIVVISRMGIPADDSRKMHDSLIQHWSRLTRKRQ